MTVIERLDAVCEVTMGQAPAGESYNSDGAGLPLIAGAGDFGEVYPRAKKFTDAPTKVCRSGDIILGIRATIGEKVLADRDYCLGRGVAALRARPGLDPRYLWHWLTHTAPTLASKAKGATFKQVNKQDIGELSITLPCLQEQQRIAEMLDQADELRAKRSAALAQLGELPAALYIDSFGDPVTNPEQWPLRSGASVCRRITVGVVVRPASYYREHGVPALRSLNIRPGKIVTDSLVYFSREDNETTLAKSRLRQGDVVVVRSGQPGTAAVVPPELDGANAIDIIIATPDTSKVTGRFLSAFLNSAGGRRIVLGAQRGQVQQHFNVGSLNDAIIPVPPLSLQQEFSARLAAVERLRCRLLQSLTEMEDLIRSLQHRAFRGDI